IQLADTTRLSHREGVDAVYSILREHRDYIACYPPETRDALGWMPATSIPDLFAVDRRGISATFDWKCSVSDLASEPGKVPVGDLRYIVCEPKIVEVDELPLPTLGLIWLEHGELVPQRAAAPVRPDYMAERRLQAVAFKKLSNKYRNLQ